MRTVCRPRPRIIRLFHLLAGLTALALAASPAAGLTLEEAIALSLGRNERARAADEAMRAAGARVARARSFLLPDLTLDGDYTRRSHETRRTAQARRSAPRWPSP